VFDLFRLLLLFLVLFIALWVQLCRDGICFKLLSALHYKLILLNFIPLSCSSFHDSFLFLVRKLKLFANGKMPNRLRILSEFF
jgi:hypothetical protein